jgi:hypothetical protein
MPDVLSADRQMPVGALPRPRAFDVPATFRVSMVLLGFIPMLHLIATALPLGLALTGRVNNQAAWLSPVILFLVPPLAVRLAARWKPLATGLVPPASAGFLQWWFTAQWQIIFARFPALEELMRSKNSCG